MVGEHHPKSAGAFQVGTRIRHLGLGLDQDVSLRPTPTTGPPQPSPRSASERQRHLERDVETWLAALPSSGALISFVVVATGSALDGINYAVIPRLRLSKPDQHR